MLHLSFDKEDQLIRVCKALSTPLRIGILRCLAEKQFSLIELAAELETSVSTIALNVKLLEEAGLITTELHAATKGTKRICTRNNMDILIELNQGITSACESSKLATVAMPVGHYIDCDISPTCGLLSQNSIIGSEDFPSSFFDPSRMDARLIWFRKGYVTYRFPNSLHSQKNIEISSLTLSAEICSEAPFYDLDWPSDITFWINGVEVGTWTCPSDYGDRNGLIKSHLWQRPGSTQYGVLKKITITHKGSYIDDHLVSNSKLNDYNLTDSPVMDFKIGIKENATHQGGINIFGKGCGDYDQDIIMNLHYSFKNL